MSFLTIQCTALATGLGSIVYSDTAIPLASFQNSYYSQQQIEIIPACIIQPNDASQIAEAINIIREHNCIFAIKSGGHSMFAGASNAPGGITFDMKNINDVIISEDLQSTIVGTGNTWGDVYKVLDPLNRTVIGGRDTGVGVGGFTLGGGISFLSRKYGWAVDNVRNYEVILANGTLANVNQHSAPDLYWALRGGGNNFGLVTRFNLETYPQTPAWGSFMNVLPLSLSWLSALKATFPDSTESTQKPLPLLTTLMHKLVRPLFSLTCSLGYCSPPLPVLRAFTNYALAEPGDPNSQLLLSFFKNPHTGAYFFNYGTIYSKPEPNPPIFEEFSKLPSVYYSRKIRSLSSIAAEIDSLCWVGLRNSWTAVTFKLDINLLSKLWEILISEAETLSHVPNVVPGMTLQPLNREEIALFKKNGGNCLGIDEGDWPLVVLTVNFQWTHREDDDACETANKNVIDRIMAAAKEMGLHHRYIYQNYANITQDVFAGYGEENREKLRKIQRRYDPDGVFSRLQPGYFKV
ncbi:FAD binding domain-containing protein [Stipitochalara longipes BDJ]|nr:FAD binding domain-containing protein [Stipitochalara longipes BDJ]